MSGNARKNKAAQHIKNINEKHSCESDECIVGSWMYGEPDKVLVGRKRVAMSR